MRYSLLSSAPAFRFPALLTILLFEVSLPVFSQVRNPNIPAQLVSISLSGATVFKTTRVPITKGLNKIRFTGLSPKMIENSFRVTLSDSIWIVSMEESVDTSSLHVEKLKQSLATDSLEDQILGLKLEKEALEIEKRVFTENISRIGGPNLQAAQLVSNNQVFRQQLALIHNRLLLLQKQIRKAEIALYRQRLVAAPIDTLYGKSQTVELVLNATTGFSWDVHYQYSLEGAGWSPSYSIFTKTGQQTLELHYQARITNQTGENWNHTRLALHLQNLDWDMERPDLEPWDISISRGQSGSKSEGKVSRFRLVKQNSESEESAIGTSGLATGQLSWELPQLYSLPSRVQPIEIPIKTRLFPAQFHYYAAPKFDNNVYKIGRITQWEDMNLLDGPVSVFSDRQFMGSTHLDMSQTLDTLELFCGTSSSLVINRAKRKSANSKKLLGNMEMATIGYELAIKNNGASTMLLKLADQIPITSDPRITIKTNEISDGKLDTDSGKLEWLLNLKPGESRIIPFEFEVTFPQRARVNFRQLRKSSPPKFR